MKLNNRCNKEVNCILCDELINDMGKKRKVDEDRGNLGIGTGEGATLSNMVVREGFIEKVPFEQRRRGRLPAYILERAIQGQRTKP